jgi:Asp-tRNA(Asn)/Glu-tRNA(Gln) amidotransferase A subunit family amidase
MRRINPPFSSKSYDESIQEREPVQKSVRDPAVVNLRSIPPGAAAPERTIMLNSRRDFLTAAAAGVAGIAVESHGEAQTSSAPPPQSTPVAGTPPAFGTAPAVGPDVTEATVAEAEKLVRVELTPRARAQVAGNWRRAMAPTMARRTGPKKVDLEASLAPASRWDPVLPGLAAGPARDRFLRGKGEPGPLPKRDDDLAFAPVTALSRWVESRALTSELLTRIYLERLEHFDPLLKCVITLTPDLALAQAKRADAEIAAGRYRGPLHGIPWGVKDLLDTKGIRTTWGAEPYRNRIPDTDAFVVRRLHDAGAVLVAKLSLGALALNDVWFGGETKNPWALEEGSGGSSAGPGSATAAGCVGFAIGSETEGSIIDPSMRCGVTGLRPTFGRVARTGAMTLCWSMDKLGPMTRGVEDTLLVLAAISGPDAGDLSSVPSRLDFEADGAVAGLRVGYFPTWMQESPATEVDRAALETVRRLGMAPVEVSLPDWPYASLNTILFAEAAAAFEELTLSGGLDQLRMQVPDAWPNTFRQSRFLSAVDYVQADRLRRKVAQEMARIFSTVDILLVPSLRDEILIITNFTGHPSLTLPAGFVEVGEARSDWAPDPARPLPKFSPKRRVPHGVTLIGRLFDEGTIGRAGIALEKAFGVRGERPKGF